MGLLREQKTVVELGKFYTYMYLRDDGTPYYIGKGRRWRAFKNSRRVIRKPKDPNRILVQEFDSETDAYEAERFLIDLFGRIDLKTGVLHNIAAGGKGGRGHTVAWNKGRPWSKETKKKMSLARIGKYPWSVEDRLAAGLRRKGRKHSPESIALMKEKAALRQKDARGCYIKKGL